MQALQNLCNQGGFNDVISDANGMVNRLVPQRNGFGAGNETTANAHRTDLINNNYSGGHSPNLHHNNNMIHSNQGGFSVSNMWRGGGIVQTSSGGGSGHGRVNNKLCRNGRTCQIAGCVLRHEPINKTCKFGDDCTRKDTCLFGHANRQDVVETNSNRNQIPVNDNQSGMVPKNVMGRL